MDMLGGPSGPFSFFDHLVQLKSFIWSTSDTFDLSLGCWSNCKFFQAWICLSSHITPSSTWSTWSSHRPNHRITPQLSVRLHLQQHERKTKQISLKKTKQNKLEAKRTQCLGSDEVIIWLHEVIGSSNIMLYMLYKYIYILLAGLEGNQKGMMR